MASRRRLLALVVVGGLLVVLYLGLSLAAPRRVPRLAVLPKPADSIRFEQCNGQPGARITEEWVRTGPVWTRSAFRVGGGCIDR